MIVVGLALLTFDGVLSRADAGILVLFLIIFIYYILTAGKVEQHEPTNMPKRKMAVYVFFGIILLVLGGKWVVDGAVALAQFL